MVKLSEQRIRVVIEFWPNPFWEVCTTNIAFREMRSEPDTSKKHPDVFFADDSLIRKKLPLAH